MWYKWSHARLVCHAAIRCGRRLRTQADTERPWRREPGNGPSLTRWQNRRDLGLGPVRTAASAQSIPRPSPAFGAVRGTHRTVSQRAWYSPIEMRLNSGWGAGPATRCRSTERRAPAVVGPSARRPEPAFGLRVSQADSPGTGRYRTTDAARRRAPRSAPIAGDRCCAGDLASAPRLGELRAAFARHTVPQNARRRGPCGCPPTPGGGRGIRTAPPTRCLSRASAVGRHAAARLTAFDPLWRIHEKA